MDVRRQTLVSNGPLGNAHGGSSIPVPSSVMKKPISRVPSNSRISMAPGAGGLGGAAMHNRGSLMPGGGQAAGTTMARSNSRDNLQARQSVAQGRQSVATSASGTRGDGGIYGKTPSRPPAAGSVRRSSIFPRQSMAPGMAVGFVAKDTRPVRNPQFQEQCRTNIHDYLMDTRCPYPMNVKTLVSPTQKEFQNLVHFLVQILFDGGYAWTKTFEMDCNTLLRDLKYPAHDSCGKTALGAPGTPQNWPHMLAMLNWLVDLCKALDTWKDDLGDPMLEEPTALPYDHPHLHDRILWDHSSKTYLAWFDQCQETFSVEEQELEEYYERLAQSSFDETEALETELAKLTAELKQLQVQEPPLKTLNTEYIHLVGDKTKFIHYLDQIRQKQERLLQGIERMKLANTESERVMLGLQSELAEVEKQVAAQNLSPDEVTRMNHERETLQRQLREIASKNAEAWQASQDVEMSVTRTMDRFENLMGEYTTFGHQIGTLSMTTDSSFVGPGGVDFTIECELSVEDVNKIQESGKKMREVVRPALNKYDEQIRDQTRALGEEQAGLDEESDKLVLVVEKQKSDATNRDLELAKKESEAEAAKDLHAQEATNLQTIVSRLENEVQSMSSANQAGFVAAQSDLEMTRVQFGELQHKTGVLQDYLRQELPAHLDVIVKAKTYTGETLKGIREFAESHGP